jgi:hypothetical protein
VVSAPLLAGLVLAVHLVIILFIAFGMVAVPIGAGLGWRFVRRYWWRALHLLAMVLVAAQALLGRACFLTLWQAALESNGTSPQPLIYAYVNRLIFWPLPLWVFTVFYLVLLAYTLALWRLVPPRRSRIRLQNRPFGR